MGYDQTYDEDDITEASVDGLAKGFITVGKFIGLIVLGFIISMTVAWWKKTRRR